MLITSSIRRRPLVACRLPTSPTCRNRLNLNHLLYRTDTEASPPPDTVGSKYFNIIFLIPSPPELPTALAMAWIPQSSKLFNVGSASSSGSENVSFMDFQSDSRRMDSNSPAALVSFERSEALEPAELVALPTRRVAVGPDGTAALAEPASGMLARGITRPPGRPATPRQP
jgi:hypothetical protein